MEQTTHYYPYDGTFASSTTGQPYKYNGKEYDTHNGLNWYDYGARHYDPAIARWTTQDPLAEKYYGWNAYNYCGANPVKYVDPDGKRMWPIAQKYNNFTRFHLNNFGETRANGRRHRGLDINFKDAGNKDLGAPIIATHDGLVVRIATVAKGDTDPGGNRVMIKSPDGKVSTYYMHLNDINPNLRENQEIKEGTVIGTMGGSGKGKMDEYAVHLHYEIKIDGEYINPAVNDENLIDPQIYITGINGGTLEEITVTAEAPKLRSIPMPIIK